MGNKVRKILKKDKGSITLITLVTILFIVAFLLSTFIIVVNRRQAQEGLKSEVKGIYEQNINNIDAEYDNLIAQAHSTPNAPALIDGMIAVEWNGSNWVKADESSDNWYDYGTTENTKKWANTVTVKNSGTHTRTYYKSAAVGTVIPEEDIIGMYVWIPRYSYKIPNTESGYHRANTGTTDGTYSLVNIMFMKGTSSFGTVEYNETTTNTYTKFPDGYVIHPAFDLKDADGNIIKKLTGIWVAKFEASSSTTTTDLDSNAGANYGRITNTDDVTVRPNVTSWRYSTAYQYYNACTRMTASGNIHGFQNNGDSHLMKNTEWGAVAYLTQSIYGNPQMDDKTSGVWNNCYLYGDGFQGTEETYAGHTTYSTTRTGMAFSSRDQNLSIHAERTSTDIVWDKTNGTIKIQYKTYASANTEYGNPSGSAYNRIFYEYWTENGQKASTTRNIYGIYDMAGGAQEYVAAFLDVNTAQVNNFNNVPSYHKDIYTYDSTIQAAASTTKDKRQAMYELNKYNYGDAIWETSSLGDESYSSWNSDYSAYPYSSGPIFYRGGYYDNATPAGVYYYLSNTGGVARNIGFRPVLFNTDDYEEEEVVLANAPELIDGMIAVEWNGTNWVKADTSTDTWYEYGTTTEAKRWANAVTVKETSNLDATKTRSYYLNTATAGTVIPEDDIIGMYVWIPRYSYKIDNNTGYHKRTTGTSGGTYSLIDIKFLEGTSSDGTIAYNSTTTSNYTKFPDGYVVHPAFDVVDDKGTTDRTDDEIVKKLTGIWVAKFEASSSTTTTDLESNKGSNYGRTSNNDNVTIRPNVTSWRYSTVTQFYNVCVALTENNNIHGLSTNSDSHLMKETEWGAVAYLTQSVYGNAQIDDGISGVWNNYYVYGDGYNYINSTYGNYQGYCTTRTGMVGETRDQSTSEYSQNLKEINAENTTAVAQDTINGTVTITYKDYDTGTNTYGNPAGDSYTRTYYEYWTTQGEKGSTTRNIYGIYDMSGGAWEYMATYLDVSTTELNNFKTAIGTKTYHREIYAYSGTAGVAGRQEIYEANKDKYGNAIWETSSSGNASNYSWNNDYSHSIYSSDFFVLRGGRAKFSTQAGLFSFVGYNGSNHWGYGFRPVLWTSKVE